MARNDLRTARKWRLFPRVADIGFFQGLMVSRKRLVTASLSVTIGAMAVIYVVSAWMRTSSGSPMLNVAIIATMLTTLIIAAYLDALLIGDLFFPGRWRERVLLGEDFKPENWEEEAAYVKEYNAPFFMVMVATLLALTWTSQLLTNSFLSYYQNVGFALSLMRSDNPDDRFMGLEEMANPIREAYWADEGLHEQIAMLIDDPDPEVQKMAVYTAARLNVVKSGDAMLEVFRTSEQEDVRAEAATALGRLRWERGIAYLSARLGAADLGEEEMLGILRGFALLKDPRAGRAVATLLEECDVSKGGRDLSEEVVFNAFYAMRRMEYSAGSTVAQSYLGGDRCSPSPQERCAAADALRYIATMDNVVFLERTFQTLDREHICQYAMWRYREEKSIEIIEKEPLRAKLVRAVGNRREFETYEWIWSVGADESEHPTTRKVAESYTRAMLSAYEAEKEKRR